MKTKRDLSRRGFLSVAAAVGMGGAVVRAVGDEPVVDSATAVRTLRCDAPVVRKVDVLVGGGGPSGCAAALYAARSGAKTLLLENRPSLGGVWTPVGVSHLIDGRGRDGLNAENHQRLPVHQVFQRNIYLIEDMKCLLDDMMAEAGVEVQLHARAASVAREGALVRGVFTVSKSGFEFIEAAIVIDTTGDGDIAAAAACALEQGRDFDGQTQPKTLKWRSDLPMATCPG